MKYFSTRSEHAVERSAEAILKGLAPDGGLYTPLDFGAMKVNPGSVLLLSAVDLSAKIIGRIFPDVPDDQMRSLVTESYAGKFAAADLTPLEKVGDTYVLELFHGPTSAFKDVALSVLPRLITASKEALGVSDEIVILTATSGDTGKAALEGFRDVPGTRIVVFYPDGGVSDVQKAQMVTQEGGNVRVCAIHGNFDDAQTGVKRIFTDDGANGWAAGSGARLSSANSINLGRLAPQVAYYFKAYVDLVLTGEITLGNPVNFVVPTGNFGDILAGEFARRMGLPIGRLICASNANNVLTDFLRTGRYDRRREFYRTASPSMDILVSSNLERYLFLASGGDWQLIARLMKQLSEEGFYEIPASLLAEIQKHFSAYWAGDAAAMKVISDVWKKYGYLLDPHTAVGWSARMQDREATDDAAPTVVLSTASPYKFCRDVLSAIAGTAPEDGFEAMDRLGRLTHVPIPANLRALREKQVRFADCIDKDKMLEYVQQYVRG